MTAYDLKKYHKPRVILLDTVPYIIMHMAFKEAPQTINVTEYHRWHIPLAYFERAGTTHRHNYQIMEINNNR